MLILSLGLELGERGAATGKGSEAKAAPVQEELRGLGFAAEKMVSHRKTSRK